MSAPRDGAPEKGRVYSLATLARTGSWSASDVTEEHRRTEAALIAARTEGERQGARAQYRGTADAQPTAADILAAAGYPMADGRTADAIVSTFLTAWRKGAEAMAGFLAGGVL